MVGSIDPRCETVRGTHWPNKVAWLFGARVAETILASGPKSPHQQAGHMDASDPIKPSKKLLWHGGRPHMGPGSRFAWPGRRDQIALAAILTISASSAVLKKNEMMPCAVAVRRMVLSVIPTSETCAVMPITNEKYTKSQ